MADKVVFVLQQLLKPIKLIKWKVNEGNSVSIGCVYLLYEVDGDDKHVVCKLKSTQAGTVFKLHAQEGDVVKPGESLLELQACLHPTVMRDMCAECGADLRKDDTITSASVPMIHSVPDLKVSLEQAKKIGQADVDRLLKDRKLVLLLDLDQTLIHTTNDNIPANIKDVYHFQLYGPHSPWYHTRLRPGTHRFLANMSPYFELHICTFGARNYAHMIAMFLDQDGKLFSHRILSRDECFNPTSKTANLKALFPCGDNMVCIIDDREDVWSHAANLIHVKPYHFFQHTGDINAPPGLDKQENDEKEGFDLTKINSENHKKVIKINGSVNENEINDIDKKDGNNVEDKNNDKAEVENTDKTENDKETSDLQNKSENLDKIEEVKETSHLKNKSENLDKIEEVKETSDLENKSENLDKIEDGKETSHLQNKSENLDKIEEVKETSDLENKSDNLDRIEEVKEISDLENKSENLDKIEDDEKCENNVVETEEEKMCVDVTDSKLDETNNENIVKDEENNKTNDNCEKINKEVEERVLAQNTTSTTNGENIDNESTNETDETQNKFKSYNAKSDSKDEDFIEIEDPDDYLLYLEEILKTIHKTFYEKYDKLESGNVPDLKKVIPAVRRNVLKDTKLVFSGLVPTHIKLEQSKAYQVAKSLGAIVTQDLEIDTTHLVAVRPGTAKVNAGRRKKNLKIVTPDWLWSCAERWTKAEEKLFPLSNKGSKNRHPPPHCSSPEHNSNLDEIQDTAIRKRTPSGRFMDTINPLMSFSSADIADMDREVEDIFNESESDGESSSKKRTETEAAVLRPKEESDDDSSSSAESLTGEHPRGWRRTFGKRNRDDQDGDDDSTVDEFPSTKFRRGEQLSSDLDIGQESNSEGSVDAPDEIDDGDWNMMGAALEREFLANN